MIKPGQRRAILPDDARKRRLHGRGGGALLLSLLTLPAAAHAATPSLPPLHAPVELLAPSPVPTADHPPTVPAPEDAGKAPAQPPPAASHKKPPAAPAHRSHPSATVPSTEGSRDGAPGHIPTPPPVTVPSAQVPTLHEPKPQRAPSEHTTATPVETPAQHPAPAPSGSPRALLTAPASTVAAGVRTAAPVALRDGRRRLLRGGTTAAPAVSASAAKVSKVAPPQPGSSAHVAPQPRGAAARAAFALTPVAAADRPSRDATAGRAVSLTSVLAPFGSAPAIGTAGSMTWLLVLALGALLIALMCMDAVGAGPRHDYLRRRRGRTWRPPPWH
jgi:hypothetical protein